MRALLKVLAKSLMRRFSRPAPRTTRLGVEMLEGRDVPAALVWTADGNGVFWDDPNNWEVFVNGQLSGIHQTPSSSDTLYFGALGGPNASSVANIDVTAAYIIQGSTYTADLEIVEDVTLTVLNTITAYGDTLIETGGVLESSSIYTFGSIEVAGGDYVAIVAQLLVLEGGSTLLTQETVDLEIDDVSMAAGSFWTMGTMTTVTLEGSVGSTGTITLPGLDGGGLTVTGDFTMSGGALNMFDGSVLEVQGSAPVLLQGDTTIVGGAAILADTLLMNAGTMLLDVDGVGNSGLFVSGDFELDAGTLTFADIVGTLTIGGNFSVFIATINMNVASTGVGGQGASNQIGVSGSVSIGAPVLGPTLNLNPLNTIGSGDFFDVILCTGTGSGLFYSVTPTPAAHGWANSFHIYRVVF